MKVEFIPGIAYASGTLSKNKNGFRVVVTTRKAATTNPVKTRMYIRPEECYKRKSKPSDKELAARGLFIKRQAYVKQLMDTGKYSRAEAWDIAKRDIN